MSKTNFARVVLFTAALICVGDCAKILGMFHFPSKSHHILGSTLLKALAKKGHQVTMISPFPEKEPIENYTDVELEGILKHKEEGTAIMLNASAIAKFAHSFNFIPEIARLTIHNPSVVELLKSNEKFDLMILFWPLGEAYLGIADHFNATVIGFCPLGSNTLMNYHTGNPAPFSYVPNIFLPLTDKMSFWGRVGNTLAGIFSDVLYSLVVVPFQKRLYRERFPDGKPLQELIDNVDLFLVNSHHSTETPRPYLPHVIPIGGFHVEEPQPLPKNLKTYLDEAKEGFIYVCFGSNVRASDLSDGQIEAIVKTLGKQKLKVIWKFEKDLPNKPKNVRIEKWLPQKGILAHPNIKLFISHGGMGGMSEAIYYGVPLVGVPFFGDQDSNVADAVEKGYALKVSHDQLTEENLSKAVEEILTNQSFRENIQMRSSIYREQPMKPMDKAIFWVEHVLKHRGAKHLKAVASELPLYQYYLLDVIAFLLAILFGWAASSYFVVRYMYRLAYRCFWCSKSNKKLKIK